MKLKLLICVFLIPFFALSQEWEENYKDALSNAKITDKPILLVFAGSDWCAPCIKLDRLLFQSSEFKAYSSEHLLIYKADFPRKKKNHLSAEKEQANKKLAEIFNNKGYFPLVLLLDKEENILGTFAYENKKVTEYISLINSFQK